MAIITITATSLGPQLISGIPQLLSLKTNVPATIFYTLDGTTPTTFSSVYLSPIVMPTEVSTRIRALAISGNDFGKLDLTFSTDSSDLVYPRRIDGYGMGIAVDAYNVSSVLYDGYSADDNLSVTVPSRYSDYDLEDLDIKFSRTGANGEGEGTAIENGPIIGGVPEIDPDATTTKNIYFNPQSMYIIIDGRDGYQDQSVYILNRCYANYMDLTKYLQGKSLYEPQPYVSGGLVKTFYTIKDGKGLACSYYFDHNETKWVKSIQNFDPNSIPQGVGDRREFGPAIVFKWIYNKRSMI